MPLVNVKKKVEKSADKLGFAPGESVLAGCTTNPSGTIKKMLTRQLGGAVGSAIAGKTDQAVEAGHGLADRFPDGQLFLVLTERRLFVASVSSLTGKPKEVVAQWDRAEVVDIQIEKGRMASPLTIVFSDGTAAQVEGAKGSNPDGVAQALSA